MKKLRLSSKVRRAFQGSSRGFSLIEVSIAIALIGVLAVAIMGALSYASTVLIMTDRQATAESLAKSQMEYIKNKEYEPADLGDVGTYLSLEDITPSPVPYGYTIWSLNRDDEIVDGVIGIPWNSGNNTAVYEDNGLQKITVIICYDIVRSDRKVVEEQFILEGYKRQPAAYTEV
ncbi:MAG TPA: prepilin-type N-terminal cleavage/methylation domain-containing protein [Dehalococcoidia bacterium]|nr:prepilin-type N-terminal cleavage/methylation domain-containing protein [Dehalococcoidia bacterium]